MRRRSALAGAVAALAGASCASAVRRVAVGRSLSEAVREARDGDVIEIESGAHVGQNAVITQSQLTLRGIGPRPVLHAAGQSAEGKALIVVRGGDVRIENLELRGARVASGNGAGIRLEGGRLQVERCAFFDNEMGLLTANRPTIELSVHECEFAAAPRHIGFLHHLLYVGRIGRFEISGSRLHGGFRGHLIKSRAQLNHIQANFVVDDEDGEASYELDLPNGGVAWVVGNIFGQAARTQNLAVVAFGAEADPHADSLLVMAHNTLVNRASAEGAMFVKVWRDRLPPAAEVRLLNNLFIGPGALDESSWPASTGNLRVDMPQGGDLGARAFYTATSAPVDALAAMRGVPLTPTDEFRFPLGTRALRPRSRWRPGAFQDD